MTRPDARRAGPGQETGSQKIAATSSLHSLAPITITSADLDPFTWGVLADAWNVGRRLWWLKRARDFENAKPLPGEYRGRATREQLSVRWRWCDEVARACRAKAEMVGVDEEFEDLIRDMSPIRDLSSDDGRLCPTCGTPPSPWTCSCGQTRARGIA